MISLVEEFQGKVILVAATSDKQKSDVTQFLSNYTYNPDWIRVLWDPNSFVANLYKVEKLPESYILDKQGQFVRKVAGSVDWKAESLIREVRTLANQPTKP